MIYNELIRRHHIRPWVGIIPGYTWLAENEHKLDGWRPEVELATPGVHYKLNIRSYARGVISGVMKVNE